MSIAVFDLAEDFVVHRGRSPAQHGVVATGGSSGLVAGIGILQFFVIRLVMVVLLYDLDLANELGAELKEDAFAVGTASVLFEFFAHGLDGVADL